jgi:lipoprotein-anchoring transpeptidase ErfK/SrfK
MINRRLFIASLSSLFLPAAALAQTKERERFSISREDREKVNPRFRRRKVKYASSEVPGTIIIDTPLKQLFLILGNGEAMRYGVGVGKDGFRWSGEAVIAKKAKWPKWTPTEDQIKRKPYYAQWRSGYAPGPTNPLGARALYLFKDGVDTQYRIHGTNEPDTIGKKVSSGCLRMINYDVADLYDRVEVGAKVIVL